MEYIGNCLCCGQSRMVELKEAEDPTADELNEAATMACDCEGAKLEQKIAKQISAAKSMIEEIFESHPKIQQVLMDSVEYIVYHDIDKVTVASGDVKASINLTSKGSIKINRSDQKQNAVEV